MYCVYQWNYDYGDDKYFVAVKNYYNKKTIYK